MTWKYLTSTFFFYFICFYLFYLEGYFSLPRTNDFYFYKYIMQIQFIYIKYIKKLKINYNNLFEVL
jgi:hypothetical protein